jgi:hypothetical protein
MEGVEKPGVKESNPIARKELINPKYMCKIILLSDFAEEYGKNLLRGIARYSKDHGPWTFCRMPGYYRETIGIPEEIRAAESFIDRKRPSAYGLW